MADLILAAVITAAAACAVVYIVRKRKKGECVGCSECNRANGACKNCPHAVRKEKY